MAGFEVAGTNTQIPTLWASAPNGEPTFVFVRDDSSDGKESTCVQVATLDWVREQFYEFLNDNRVDVPVDYREAYIKTPHQPGLLQRCELGTAAGATFGDGPRIMVTSDIGVIAMYEI